MYLADKTFKNKLENKDANIEYINYPKFRNIGEVVAALKNVEQKSTALSTKAWPSMVYNFTS